MSPPPRLRSSVLAFRRDHTLQFIRLMDLRVTEFVVDEYVFDMVPLLDGTRSVEQLHSALADSHKITLDEVRGVVDVVRAERLLDRAETSETPERFERQAYLFDEYIAAFDHLPTSAADLQRRLSDAAVVVIGAGGAGTWLLQSLVAIGVGRIEVIDPDVVETTNLNRQLLYRPRDVGRPKVEVASERLSEIDDGTIVRGHRLWIAAASDLASIIEGADLVVNCADEPDVYTMSDIVAEASRRARVPHIVGGAYGANLGVPGTSVVPGRTVCWPCIRHATADDHGRGSLTAVKGRTRSAGSTAPITGLIANLMAWESMRILLGLPLALSDGVRELDLFSLDWRERRVSGRDGCVDCRSAAGDPAV